MSFFLLSCLLILCKSSVKPIDRSGFAALPTELKHRIFDGLSKMDMLRSIVRVNRATYHDYYLQRYHRIHRLHDIVLSLHSTNPFSEDMMTVLMNLISNQTSNLVLNEVFQIQCRRLLTAVCAYSMPLPSRILSAMNIRQISMIKLTEMRIGDKLKMFILSSRALAPVSSIPGQVFRGDAEYPWIGSNFLVSFTFLYQYLFEEYHSEFGIQPLDSLFDVDDVAKAQRLRHLVDDYGFIPWHRSYVEKVRRNWIASCPWSGETKLIELVLELGHWSQQFLNKQLWNKTDVIKFLRTTIIQLSLSDAIKIEMGRGSGIMDQPLKMEIAREIVQTVALESYVRSVCGVTQFDELCQVLASSAFFTEDYVQKFRNDGIGPHDCALKAMIVNLLKMRNDWNLQFTEEESDSDADSDSPVYSFHSMI